MRAVLVRVGVVVGLGLVVTGRDVGASLEECAGGERRVGARLRLNRQHWGVVYRYDPIGNEIVDDDIHLRLEMVFPAPRAEVRR